MKIKSFVFATLFVGLIFPSFIFAAGDANINLSSSLKTVTAGGRTTVEVYASSPTQSLNAISGNVVFPSNLLQIVEISRGGSIIDFWTEEPHAIGNRIKFEGIVLNPGYSGGHGSIFKITFEGRSEGNARVYLSDGAVLANDGLGSNIAGNLGSTNILIKAGGFLPGTIATIPSTTRPLALPVITDYSHIVDAKGFGYVKGKGEPGALTKIVFKDVSLKSIGEKFIEYIQTKKKKLDEVLVKNDANGAFEYTSPNNLVAGAYNATPFLVDESTNTEKPGLGVQLLVSDSKIVKILVVIINVLGLLIPVVGLGMIVYFIPWYSFKKMRVMKRQLGLEEEKIVLSEHELLRQDKILDKSVENFHPHK